MERIGAAPPSTLAGIEVAEVTDYRVGAEDRPRYLAATPLVALDLRARGRALVRPSGTEPKLKIYVDLVADRDEEVDAAEQELALTAEANEVADALAGQLGL
jgi:phosphomannomutase